MKQIILDMGSGNICRNNRDKISEMIYSISDADTGRNRIVFKWQLFTDNTINYLEPLQHGSFDYAYKLAANLGYQTTSSVFDDDSLEFLQKHYDVPFIKIACNPKYYPLLWHVNPYIDKYVSINNGCNINSLFTVYEGLKIMPLCCISEYPAHIDKYEDDFERGQLMQGISDHTCDKKLFDKYKPDIYECHFIPAHGYADDPYGDSFCRTVEELKEII